MTEYDYVLNPPRARLVGPDGTVRDGRTIIQYMYNGTGLNPRSTRGTARGHRRCPQYQAAAGDPGAFIDLPTALQTWQNNAGCC